MIPVNKPVPSVKGMLEIGEACGLLTVEEAVFNYLGHYDCFFYIPEYKEQYMAFVEDLKVLGFAVQKDKVCIVDMKIVDALEMLK